MVIFLVILVVLGALLLFWPDFRHWVGDQLDAIATLLPVFLQTVWNTAIRVLRTYAVITLIVVFIMAVLIILGTVIDAPIFTAICFLLAIILFMAVWLMPGIILRLFGVTDSVFPQIVRVAVAWLAFLGFLGLLYPDALNMKVVLGLALLGFFTLGLAGKANILDTIVYPLVVFMVFVAVWKYVAPESYRSTVRHINSKGTQLNAWHDRSSIENEASASVTYARPNRPISVAYVPVYKEGDTIIAMKEGTVNLNTNSLVKVFNHKNKVEVYEGQGFVEIQLPKANGSFVNGPHCWVEADFINIVTPGDIQDEMEGEGSTDGWESVPYRAVTLQPAGSPYRYLIKPGEETNWFKIPAGCTYDVQAHHVSDPNARMSYVLVYDDGTVVNFQDGQNKVLPDKPNATFRIGSKDSRPIKFEIIVLTTNNI